MYLSTQCPTCKTPLWLMSTANQWRLYCKPCDVRYDDNLRRKTDSDDCDPRYSAKREAATRYLWACRVCGRARMYPIHTDPLHVGFHEFIKMETPVEGLLVTP